MLGITTADSPDDLVIRTRKRPAATSTNAAIVRPVFGDEYTKDLAIPNLIDAYNHHMGGVDIANQLRASYSAHNRRQKRYWKALFLWLLDLAVTNSYLISQWPRPRKPESREHRRFMDELAKSLMEMPLDPPNVNPPANVEPSADAEPSADVEPQSIVEPQAVDPAIESLDIEPPHVEWLPDTEQLDTDNIDRPNVERPAVEWQDIEWPAVEWPDVERRQEIEPQEIEPRSSELPGRHVQEKGGKRAFCAYCRQHKEDWRPYKHKPIQRGQVSRAFGTDVTNRMPNTIPNGRGKKDTRGYRIRGSKTIPYCGICNVALCKQGISRVTPNSKYPRNLHVLNDLCL